MKKMPLLLIIFGAITMGPSCEMKTDFDSLAQDTRDMLNNYSLGSTDIWPDEDGCILESYKLVGERNLTLGTVQVITSYGRAFIKYEVNEGFMIKRTHVFVGDAEDDLPVGVMGKPKLMQFPYVWGHVQGSRVVVQEVDLGGVNHIFDIAAHAIISSADGEMSAWAHRTDAILISKGVSGKPRGWYVNYHATGCFASLPLA